MSSDTTFAAQFWLWPDPAMKRDSQGRVLFVNAAFLQLYGGSVEAWAGNVLQGWPAPQPLQTGIAPSPYRFETRIPSHDMTMAEQVYDWIEQTEADGSAFAIARNVSIYAQAPTSPPPGQPMDTPTDIIQAETSSECQVTAQVTTSQAVPAFEHAPVLESTSEPVQETPQTEQFYLEPAQVQVENSVAPIENTLPVDLQTDSVPVVEAEVRQEERSFERRALPIESNSAVLGNNWRDAVIAKAVGVESAEPAPMPTEQASLVAPTESSTGSDGPKRILLAEDNAINALLTRTLLEAEGHLVETVEDGALAVEAMKTQSFDLIFMDMRMPNMDGLESTRKIRQLPNVPQNLPIIALTANAFDDDRNACFDSGMNDFMTKPVSAEELSLMVKNWTGKKDLEMAS